MNASAPIITLLSDFGTADGYVGAMKGVLLGRCPNANIVDLTHEIDPGDVFAGAVALKTAASWFPAGAVHVAVVDPGVGGDRKAVMIESEGRLFVGPDNGLLSLAAPPPRRVYEILLRDEIGATPSPTFHGCDVFAPAAGALASGKRPSDLGRLLDGIVQLRLPKLDRRDDDVWAARVVHVDRFGNAVLNLTAEQIGRFPGDPIFRIAQTELTGLTRTYSDVGEGEPLALVGSGGFVEVAVRNGSAAERFEISRGSIVHIEQAGSAGQECQSQQAERVEGLGETDESADEEA